MRTHDIVFEPTTDSCTRVLYKTIWSEPEIYRVPTTLWLYPQGTNKQRPQGIDHKVQALLFAAGYFCIHDACSASKLAMP